MEERQLSENQSNPSAQFKRIPIKIPSHAEVQQQSRPQPPPSLFQSSSRLPETPDRPDTFTQAFSFVKKTKSYSPPPAPPPPSASIEGTQNSAVISSNLTTGQALKPDVAALQCRNSILVSKRQQGNPVLKHIKNIRWVFSDIVPDYILGQNSCALYLSLRYHLLHPDYIYFRIRELQKSFRLRVVLCYVDVEDVVKPLHEVTKTALLHDCTLLCSWSVEECARYLETIKIYENKPADNIQERTDNDYLSRLTSALTTIRHVNKTNVVTLGSTFGSLAGIMGASMEELARCPDIGERKVKRLYDAFHEPFRRKIKQARLPNMGFVNKTPDSVEPSKDQQNVEEDTKPPSPKDSVRRALDIAYEKHGEKLNLLRSTPSTVEGNKTEKPPDECEASDV